MQTMLFAMLQEQHDKQITTMAANNKANMNVMMECMNAIVAARGRNKENSPPNAGAKKAAKSGRLSKRVKASNCKKMVVHLAKYCYKLEANKDKRYDRWVSCLPVTATAWHQLGTNKVELYAAN